MRPRMIISLEALVALGLLGCSHQGKGKQPLGKVDPGTQYTTVIFKEGQASLSALNKKDVRALAEKAQQGEKRIGEIRILAWADHEYPQGKQKKGTPRDILLAAERARNIREYLENVLLEDSAIDSYNMAKRPGLMSSLLKTDEYQTRKTFEAAGMTASRLPGGEISYTKASKAIVIIDYEGADK